MRFNEKEKKLLLKWQGKLRRLAKKAEKINKLSA